MSVRWFVCRVAPALAVLAFLARPASAQDPAASWRCDAKAGTLVIRYVPELSEATPPWPKAPAPIHFMSLLELDKAETIVEGTKSETVTCRLKSDAFEITFDPGVPNPNLAGRCGAAVTGVVTVKRNGVAVLDEQEFEAMNCHEREQFLASITFKDGSPTPVLVHKKYDQ